MSLEDRLDDLEEAFEDHLEEDFPDCKWTRALGEMSLVVPREQLLPVMEILRSNSNLSFEQCIDVCGVDYAAYGHSEWNAEDAPNTGFSRGAERELVTEFEAESRFAVVYHLLSLAHNVRLRVKVFLDADYPVVDSVTGIWTGANWFEREAFDLFGILFNGHPDLRRILTDYGFIGHPFRKDFPMVGQVEMRYDEDKGRVVYEPVTVEQRTLVPRIVRHDYRYEEGCAPVSEEEQEPADG
ncbi:NADH-quinone oxidoreductase subunit C [Thiolapillus brandeum]|uniref:NADH-quinone oxidoreductase subunit C n=1 Tax=Thiolapillus brandeum TaxID=1076588 RepID=A0A7U6GI92_9GAMM|nr:NADH-quinone oxidoreductase subunit C [Thiolapillus brandeum]BAO44141.1 NADH dehydrogenase I subunit C [Thiolapillus brandeum]